MDEKGARRCPGCSALGLTLLQESLVHRVLKLGVVHGPEALER